MSFTGNKITRRAALTGAVAFGAALPMTAWAISEAAAERLVASAVADITSVINSGKAEAAMYRDFERILARYGDMSTISRAVLGPAARSASRSEMSAFANAFQGYMARKYGRQFRDFEGGDVTVTGVRDLDRFVEVEAVARLRGQSPFQVSFMVSDRSGSDKFFDLVVEGISLIRTEQTEIGTMLDARRGSISQLTRDLAGMG